MVNLAFPNKKLTSYKIISGGCANLNIIINLETEEQPVLLRVYLRDNDAAYREQNLGILLKKTIPIPQVYYVGGYDNHRFAIAEFMFGITLRDLLLSDQPHDVSAIMYDVGKMLAKIQTYQFAKSGFFNNDLSIAKILSQKDYIEFSNSCLHNATVIEQLGAVLLVKIKPYLNKYQSFFPDGKEKNLVHADFDPANILVAKKNGEWKITAILDWEFSFSGSTLTDVANMLRYAHQMPSTFEKSFLEGLNEGGVNLPQDWCITVNMLNLSSLLDCLMRTEGKQCPNQCADIRALIQHIIGDH